MQEKLNQLRKDCLLEVEICNGLGSNPGIISTIITKGKELYTYNNYYRKSEEYISQGIKLKDNQYQKIINFINNNIIGKEIKSYKMRDSNIIIKGNYQNISFHISNNRKFLDEVGVCDTALQIINEIKGDE